MGKPDPRAEPALGENDKADHSVDRVVSEITAVPADEPASGVTAKEPVLETLETKVEAAPKEEPKKEPSLSDTQKRRAFAITNSDPRFAEIEPLIETNDWQAVAKKLGPID